MDWRARVEELRTPAVIVALVVAFGVGVVQLTDRPTGQDKAPPDATYYWDVETGQVFIASRDTLPPIQAPSGGEGVRAHLFACGSCSTGERFGYLEKYSEAYHEAWQPGERLDVPPAQLPQFVYDNHFVRSLEEEAWVRRNSGAGEHIRRHVRTRCASRSELIRCTP